ncbi:MAG: hypothetical protein STSR0008_07170 [Ignavibacterium sp.]
MLNFFKNILLGSNNQNEENISSDEQSKSFDINSKNNVHKENKKIQIATCALLIEAAKADSIITNEEYKNIIFTMKNLFNLNEEEVSNLIKLSEEKVNQSVSIYEFTSTINEYFNEDQKLELLKNLWKGIFSDERLHPYEDSLMKKISTTLNIGHRDLINAKLLAKQELNI